MNDNARYSDDLSELSEAFAALTDTEDVKAFLLDLCSPKELGAMVQRLQVAKGLSEGETYGSLRERLGVSNTTITRVSSELSYGNGGYKKVIYSKSEKNS